MSYGTVGTCSICSGPVMIPTLWESVIPPTPTCSRCGAVAASHGPVIPMVKPYSPKLDDICAPEAKGIKDYLLRQKQTSKNYNVTTVEPTEFHGPFGVIREDNLTLKKKIKSVS